MPPPLVLIPECRVEPVEPGTVEMPPLPDLLPRPASNAPASAFLAYDDSRRERAELAGLYYQSDRDAVRQAYDTNAATQRVCAAWAREH